jgi:glycylpeptide N-tetradecanoyltransferase
MIRLNAVPNTLAIPGIREMEEKDVLAVAHLFTRFIKRFTMHPIFDVDEIKHQFSSGMGKGNIGDGGPGRRQGQVTWTYVVEVSLSCRRLSKSGTHDYTSCRILGRIK